MLNCALEACDVGCHSEKDAPAVEVKQKASPAIHDDATVPATPARGMEKRIPMVVEDEEHS